MLIDAESRMEARFSTFSAFSHAVQLWFLFKTVISFCLNSTVKPYNITAKLGTFFMSHPVLYRTTHELFSLGHISPTYFVQIRWIVVKIWTRNKNQKRTRNKSNASLEAVQHRQDVSHVANYITTEKTSLPIQVARKITVVRAQKIGKSAVWNLILRSGVIWQRREKLEYGCTTTYHPL